MSLARRVAVSWLVIALVSSGCGDTDECERARGAGGGVVSLSGEARRAYQSGSLCAAAVVGVGVDTFVADVVLIEGLIDCPFSSPADVACFRRGALTDRDAETVVRGLSLNSCSLVAVGDPARTRYPRDGVLAPDASRAEYHQTLSHEAIHQLLYRTTGDGDGDHERPGIWGCRGSGGCVVCAPR